MVTVHGCRFTVHGFFLEGITVGEHKLSDQHIAVNQGEAWRTLFEWIKKGRFEVTAEKACELHQIAGKEESLEWGKFRFGGVTIAGTDYMPPKAGILPGQLHQNFRPLKIK